MASSLRFLSYIQVETSPWQMEIEPHKRMTWIKDPDMNIIVRWSAAEAIEKNGLSRRWKLKQNLRRCQYWGENRK